MEIFDKDLREVSIGLNCSKVSRECSRPRGSTCKGPEAGFGAESLTRGGTEKAGTGEEWGAEGLAGCCEGVGVYSGCAVNTQGPEQRRQG